MKGPGGRDDGGQRDAGSRMLILGLGLWDGMMGGGYGHTERGEAVT